MPYSMNNSADSMQGFEFRLIADEDEHSQPGMSMESDGGIGSMVNDPMYNMSGLFDTDGSIGTNAINNAWAAVGYTAVDPSCMLPEGGSPNAELENTQHMRQPLPTLQIPVQSSSRFAHLDDISPHLSELPNFSVPNNPNAYNYTALDMLRIQGSPLTPPSPFTSSQGSPFSSPFGGSARGRSRHSSVTRLSPIHGRGRSLSSSRSEIGMMGAMSLGGEGYNSELLQVPHIGVTDNFTGGGSAPVTPADYYSPLPYTDGLPESHSLGASPISSFTDVRDVVGSNAITQSTKDRRIRDARFYCPRPDCNGSFTAKHNLTNHINSHNNKRNHHCRHRCGGKFVTSSVKTRHEKTCKYRIQPLASSSRRKA